MTAGSTTTLKRNFLCEVDDLVDELLEAINKQGWSNLKMKYELGSLTATRSVKSMSNGKLHDLNYALSAQWQEQDEEVELILNVASEDQSADNHAGAALAQELIQSMFADSSYRWVTESSGEGSVE